MSSYVFMSCLECVWSSGDGEGQSKGNQETKEGKQLFNIIKEEEIWTCKVEEDLREKSRNLSGLPPLNKFSVKSTLLTYALVKMDSFIQSNTEFCISVAQDCTQTQERNRGHIWLIHRYKLIPLMYSFLVLTNLYMHEVCLQKQVYKTF